MSLEIEIEVLNAGGNQSASETAKLVQVPTRRRGIFERMLLGWPMRSVGREVGVTAAIEFADVGVNLTFDTKRLLKAKRIQVHMNEIGANRVSISMEDVTPKAASADAPTAGADAPKAEPAAPAAG